MTEYIDTTATSERGTLRPLTGREQWSAGHDAAMRRRQERERIEREDIGEPISGRDALALSLWMWCGLAAWIGAICWWLA